MFINKKDERKIHNALEHYKINKLSITVFEHEKNILSTIRDTYILPSVLNNIIYEYTLNHYNIELTFIDKSTIVIYLDITNQYYTVTMKKSDNKYKPYVNNYYSHKKQFEENKLDYNYYHFLKYFLQNETGIAIYKDNWSEYGYITHEIFKISTHGSTNNYHVTVFKYINMHVGSQCDAQIEICNNNQFITISKLLLFIIDLITKEYNLTKN